MSAVGRIGGVGRLGLVAAAVRQLFDPRSFFTAGEQGVWYDPSDLTTLFQDSAGTTPVTAVEQPVGLMLDKRLGLVLGSELVTNGTFDADVSGWGVITGAAISLDDGRLKSVTTTSAGPKQQLSLVVGKTYKVVGTIQGPATNEVSLGILVNSEVSFAKETTRAIRSTPTEVTFVFTATETNSKIYMRGAGAGTFYLDNISVRELPGAHATQPTATARPAYRESPQRVNFDAVDDVHTTTFPASLGSNCTIARAIPGVGASILTSQTVGTTFNNTITHAGMLIVDRALNTGETAMLTAYLNAKAGV